jgi:hypothetical protein
MLALMTPEGTYPGCAAAERMKLRTKRDEWATGLLRFGDEAWPDKASLP